jgi:DNA-binding transcriptional LysR family regulator
VYRTIDPDLLRTFLAVCETGKFSAAAEKVGRTQAAVSLQIKRLEGLLGKPLFERDNRNVSLNTAGEILKDYAQKLIDLNDETFLRVSETDISGVLRLGAPEAITSTHLPKILALFNKNHPTVVLDVTCKLTDELLVDFDQGDYDVVIFKREKSNRKSGTVVYHEKLAWIMSAGATLDYSKSLPMILSPHPCIYRRLAIEALEKSRKDWRAVMTAHSLSGRLSAVKNGLGISLMPEDMIDDRLEIISEMAELPKAPDLEMAVLSSENKNQVLSSSFIEHLIHYFENVS